MDFPGKTAWDHWCACKVRQLKCLQKDGETKNYHFHSRLICAKICLFRILKSKGIFFFSYWNVYKQVNLIWIQQWNGETAFFFMLGKKLWWKNVKKWLCSVVIFHICNILKGNTNEDFMKMSVMISDSHHKVRKLIMANIIVPPTSHFHICDESTTILSCINSSIYLTDTFQVLAVIFHE